MITKLFKIMAFMALVLFTSAAYSADGADYKLSPGDAIRITVFQNPDLSMETRVSGSGSITFPLIGAVQVGGLSTHAAEQLIEQKLKSGNFVKRPQVNITLIEVRGSQVSVLGHVNAPGRFPLEMAGTRLSEMLALAGGVLESAGSGTAIVTGTRNGKPLRQEVDIASVFLKEGSGQDLQLMSGDVVYVVPGNQVSVLGQVNRPGRYPLERANMKLTEVLTLAGGMSPEGSDSVIVSGMRAGKPFRQQVDIAQLYLNEQGTGNMVLAAGDEVFVDRAPVFYIYGEAQKPGSYRVERNMTVIQALAQGGGPTVRGTQRNIKLLRRNTNGAVEELSPKMTDLVRANDVLFVRESLF